MSVKLRFVLVLGLLLLGLLAALVVMRAMAHRETEQLLADERQNRTRLLNHWIDLTTRALPQFAADYAASEELVDLAAQPAARELHRKVTAGMAAAGVHALWLLRPDGTPRLQLANDGTAAAPPPLAANEFAALLAQTPSPRFFAEDRSGLLEICARRLPAPADPSRREAARDWVVAARRWDNTQLQTLASLTESAVSLTAPGDTISPPSSPSELVLLRPLADWQGHPLRMLRVEYHAPEFTQLLQTDSREAGVFVVFGLLLIVALALAVHAWVLRPLGQISASLAHGSTQPIASLRAEPNELGRVAQLVESSFAQRDALRHEVEERTRAQEALQRSEASLRRTIEERVRLGRDLHDGVIQSLYAAGMGLASIPPLLRSDQVEAAARLEQTRGALNETIHDVRNFIGGLEPESLRLQGFAQAVTALLEVVQGLRPLQASVEIDESVAAQLTLAQRVHALQIAREAVSNALRHGEATQVRIALRPAGENVEFEIADNGRGFDPAAQAAHGLGLGNFTERARELGAELTVASAPGQGVRVRLVFSLFKSL